MKLRDMTELAVRNLREAIFRNTLTTLGVAVGVASLVAMLSLGVGLQQLASSRLTKSGLFDTVFVSPKLNLRGGPPAAASQQAGTRLLDEDARLEISKLPNVIEVFPQIRFPTEVRFSDKPFPTVVAGMPLSSKLTGAFDGMKGEFFSSESADEAILQIEFAKELSPDTASLVGKTLAIRYAERQQLDDGSGGFSIVPKEKQLRIIGIVETEPASGFGGYGNGRLLIPIGVAQSLRAAQVNDLRDVVRGFRVLDLLLGLFASLALAVATLGIVNTLVMAILERRREIGVLKALGAADSDVKRLFFVEAGVMGFIGGIAGVILGWLIGRGLTLATNIYLKRQDLPSVEISSVPWWLVLSAISFAVLVSLVAGLYPASRAAKLDPVQALRYE